MGAKVSPEPARSRREANENPRLAACTSADLRRVFTVVVTTQHREAAP